MRVRAVTFDNTAGYGYFDIKPQNILDACSSSLYHNYNPIDDLAFTPYYYPITFTSIQNSSKMRILFEYKLPCMYSGIPMIDAKQVSKLLKNKTFYKPAKESLQILNSYSESIVGMEAQLLKILNERAKIHPNLNIQELLKEIEPIYMRQLRKIQAPIFYRLEELAGELPSEYHEKFVQLMAKTDKKLNERPLIIPFSSFEFKYKLVKIKDSIITGKNLKSKKVINKMIKESKKFSDSTNSLTIENQKRVIRLLDWILKKSVLSDNEQLRQLIDISKSRLLNEEIIVPFSRKSFIYDLSRILEPVENKDLQDKIIQEALKLPTSGQNFAAYLMKIASEPPDKIGYRILWPSIASVEHIFPKSCGGPDTMANFGGATTRENSARKSMDFAEWMNLKPQIPKYCQMYVDRLIELYKQGIFEKHNINPKYIEDFKQAIYNQSQHKINLDISEMYSN